MVKTSTIELSNKSPQEIAEILVARLTTDNWIPENRSLLTPQQWCLLADTRGLLNGIASGNISFGNDRIQKNLIDLAGGFSSKSKLVDSTVYPDPVTEFQAVLEAAAEHKLSISGHDLTKRRRENTSTQPLL